MMHMSNWQIMFVLISIGKKQKRSYLIGVDDVNRLFAH